MAVISEVPVTKQKGEDFVLGRHVPGHGADAVESLLFRGGGEVHIPDVQIPFVAAQLEYRHSPFYVFGPG